MEMGLGKIVVILLVCALCFLPFAALYRLFSLTPIGRGLARRNETLPGNNVTLEVADQLRVLQAQLDDAHSRLDFAERVMLEQREQLRALGAPEPHAELYEPTPV
jgi:hypothetical protein